MCFRSHSIVVMGLLVAMALVTNSASADGPRVRLFQNRPASQPSRTSSQPERSVARIRTNGSTSEATAATSGASRLPAGRNYYQGRYYGNFNNRFYGPQYGYF